MKELKDTVYMMNSSDYKERFKAEYWQTKIRYEKLKKFNTKIEAAELMRYEKKTVEEPKHDCPYHFLRDQQRVMAEYLHILEVRAEIEGIDLDNTSLSISYTALAQGINTALDDITAIRTTDAISSLAGTYK